MKKEKNNLLSILITTIILILLFVVILGVLNKKGYLSFNFKNKQSIPTEAQVDNGKNNIINNNDSTVSTDNTNNNDLIKKANTNMTTNEVFDLWNKIKGNWASVQFNDNTCAGLSLEINYFIKFSKFNSDGITSWSIVSYEKINDTQYKANLIAPVDLINQMNGDIVAHYNTVTIDISKLDDKVLRIYQGDRYVDYQYVGENKGEIKNFQYIDGGFSQDYYCDWYKNNH